MAKRKATETSAPARPVKQAKIATTKPAAPVTTRSGRAVSKPKDLDSFVDSALILEDAEESGESDASVEPQTVAATARPTIIGGGNDADDDLSNVSDDSYDRASVDLVSDDGSDEEPARRRRMSTTPELPTLQEWNASDMTDTEEDAMSEAEEFSKQLTCQTNRVPHTAPLNITLNIEAGPSRQIIIKIDRQVMQQLQAVQDGEQPAREHSPELGTERPPPKDQLDAAGLFGTLPAELRSKIYNILFRASFALDLSAPCIHFSRSAAFLRTCKLVHNEGRSVLYGANHFNFARRFKQHGSMWERHWTELGYLPCRVWLKSIGGTNSGLIRSITLKLTDATSRSDFRVTDMEARRFIYNPALKSCLRHLVRHGRLAFLQVQFEGRARLDTSNKNASFLDLLCQVQTDTVDIHKPIWRIGNAKHTLVVERLIKKSMKRDQRLYPQGVFNGVDNRGNLLPSTSSA